MVSPSCHAGVPVTLWRCPGYVVMVSQSCCDGVSVMFWWCPWSCCDSVPVMLWWCPRHVMLSRSPCDGVPVMLWWYPNHVVTVSRSCLMVPWSFCDGVPVMWWWCPRKRWSMCWKQQLFPDFSFCPGLYLAIGVSSWANFFATSYSITDCTKKSWLLDNSTLTISLLGIAWQSPFSLSGQPSSSFSNFSALLVYFDGIPSFKGKGLEQPAFCKFNCSTNSLNSRQFHSRPLAV